MIDCPGFHDEELTAWFPYSNNQSLIFQSSSNERDTFTLVNWGTTEPGKQPSPTCSAQNMFDSYTNDSDHKVNFSVALSTSSRPYNNEISKSAYISVGTNGIEFNDLKDTGFIRIEINYSEATAKHVPSVILGNTTYSNVIAVTKDTTKDKSSGMYKAYYIKNKGLIGWEEYPTLKTWGIQ
jgi:hypothetical protein